MPRLVAAASVKNRAAIRTHVELALAARQQEFIGTQLLAGSQVPANQFRLGNRVVFNAGVKAIAKVLPPSTTRDPNILQPSC